jgi:hypothetical protein
MVAHHEEPCPLININGLVATFLRDVAERPVPPAAQTRLAEIRRATAEGNATMDMALEIIDMFPNRTAAR